MSLYIFAATEMEAKPLRSIATQNDAVLVTPGMGPKNARAKAEAVLSGGRKPDAVLITGLCGGVIPSLPEGRLVAYTGCQTTERSNSSVNCSQTITDSITTVLAASNLVCDRVVGITASHIATTPAKRSVLAQAGAAVVDMESYSILDVAASNGVPAVVLRIVSDGFDRTLPDFNRALNEDGGLDGRKALRIALASPLSTARLIAANKRAMQNLSEALAIILKKGCFAKAAV